MTKGDYVESDHSTRGQDRRTPLQVNMDLPWTHDEIAAYLPDFYPPLQNLYESAGIGADPQKRAQYLAEEVLHPTATDQDVIMREANQRGGRTNSLNLMERMVIAAHKEKINRHRETIFLPLSEDETSTT